MRWVGQGHCLASSQMHDVCAPATETPGKRPSSRIHTKQGEFRLRRVCRAHLCTHNCKLSTPQGRAKHAGNSYRTRVSFSKRYVENLHARARAPAETCAQKPPPWSTRHHTEKFGFCDFAQQHRLSMLLCEPFSSVSRHEKLDLQEARPRAVSSGQLCHGHGTHTEKQVHIDINPLLH